MSTQESGGQKHAEQRTDEVDEAPTDATSSDVVERHEALSEDVDAILDEIDEVLEENAEEFVRAFVQKGGE
jgi:ubiquitin-like protein Pup